VGPLIVAFGPPNFIDDIPCPGIVFAPGIGGVSESWKMAKPNFHIIQRDRDFTEQVSKLRTQHNHSARK
jgi:hypothetical protein